MHRSPTAPLLLVQLVAVLAAVVQLQISYAAASAYSAYLVQQQQDLDNGQPQFPSLLVDRAIGSQPIIQQINANPYVSENRRASFPCMLSSGESPVSFQWFKDGAPLSNASSSEKRFQIQLSNDVTSILTFDNVKLEHSGNYTCLARNKFGYATMSQMLIVQSEPKWLREPPKKSVTSARGSTVVIDCQTMGNPQPHQTWKVKSSRHSEYEPIGASAFNASGRMFIAANGSLIIKNARKLDEAHYLCTATNGIGKPLSANTTLRVTVPAHFAESDKRRVMSVRKSAPVQLRCDAFGDLPVGIDWARNKQRLSQDLLVDTRYSIQNTPNPSSSGFISTLNIKNVDRSDNALFECLAQNSVGKDSLSIELLVTEEPDPIQDIQATQLGSRSVTLVWTEPYDGKSPITSYKFVYKREPQFAGNAQHEDLQPSGLPSSSYEPAIINDAVFDYSTQYGASAPPPNVGHMQPSEIDDWTSARIVHVPVNSTLGPQNLAALASGAPLASISPIRQLTIEKLEPASRYVLRAFAINAIGFSHASSSMEFSTDEEKPDSSVTNVRVTPMNSTAILVSWDELPVSKTHNSRLHGYYIGHRELQPSSANASSRAMYALENANFENFIYKQYYMPEMSTAMQQRVLQRRLEFVVNDLKRDTLYEVTVSAFNARGKGPSSSYVRAKTVEMETPKPVRLSVRQESNESILLDWSRDPTDQNPVDDFVLYQEKNSEWNQVRLPGNQTQYRAFGLKCGTKYQFYMVALNKVGKSPASETVSAATNGSLPQAPSKLALLKMANSSCLAINLNAFQDSGCRIKSFAIRYKLDRVYSSKTTAVQLAASAQSEVQVQQTLASSNADLSSASSQLSNEWINLRLRSTAHARPSDERLEYICDLNANGEYSIHVTASNDVGRTEAEYSVLMSSSEWRRSPARELFDFLFSGSSAVGFVARVQTLFLLVIIALLLSFVLRVCFATAVSYYHKFTILQNQLRATRRANRDAKRRRNLAQGSALSTSVGKHLDSWVDDYNHFGNDDDDDDDDDDDEHHANDVVNNFDASEQSNARALHNAFDDFNGVSSSDGLDSRCSSSTSCNGGSSTSARSSPLKAKKCSPDKALHANKHSNTMACRRTRSCAYPKHIRSSSGNFVAAPSNSPNNNANYIGTLSSKSQPGCLSKQQHLKQSNCYDSSSMLTCDSRQFCQKFNAASAGNLHSSPADQFAYLSNAQCVKMNEYSLMPSLLMQHPQAASLQQSQQMATTSGSSSSSSVSACSTSPSQVPSSQVHPQHQTPPHGQRRLSNIATAANHVWYAPSSGCATILPAGVSPQEAIYGEHRQPKQATSSQQHRTVEPIYYSTLRHSSMQTYLPQQATRMQQQQQQQQQIYGYHYLPAQQPPPQQQQQQTATATSLPLIENSIYVPPKTSTVGQSSVAQQANSQQQIRGNQLTPPRNNQATLYSFI